MAGLFVVALAMALLAASLAAPAAWTVVRHAATPMEVVHGPVQAGAAAGQDVDRRPYAAGSPWNTPIGPRPVYDRQSTAYVRALCGLVPSAPMQDPAPTFSTPTGLLSSDPTAYTIPVYQVDGTIPRRTVQILGTYSNVSGGGTRVVNVKALALKVPIPAGARPAGGQDAQMVIWNRETGDEWGFWQVVVQAGGTYSAVNGYHYNTRWSGVPPRGFISRGAGVPYLAGLIRPWEIAQGRIEHAIAFGSRSPASKHVYPATKSDGTGRFPDLPEGARLQLDPSLTDADFDRWGLSPAGKAIAHALQEYGMVLVDRSGRIKLYAESEGTARWQRTITADTVSRIPCSAFRVLEIRK
ncbi:MAG: hypothetical protein HY331_02980 [Chloroflexi bacterium]|nr:hypothetical protein [Chloroflexota bacterium]